MIEFSYLGYVMSRNTGYVVHVEYLARKAKSVFGKVARGESRRKNDAVRVTYQKCHGVWGGDIREWKERE